ncbi:hypothetical protein K1719_037915 [Acacia pycnantha]|nr:hypothetical protein K1719_037915 [Acacia pycnantha]
MASMQDPSFPLRLLVHKERNKVVVAEAGSDFVDALFSFFTLPLGTIIRLLSLEIGCINNLYQSVENSDTQVFWNEICKKMLLCPRNPCEKLCKELRFNMDDTEPTKYLICDSCSEISGKNLLSTFAGANCSCGKLMAKEIKFRVLNNSPGNTVKQLLQLGYTDSTKLSEMSPKVSLNQIMDLLKRALVSKSPLSDVFLALEDGGGSKSMSSFTLGLALRVNDGSIIDLKITMSKSMNKVMYAEAEADFSDFLFSFLTMPLGSILKLLDGNVTLGSLQNLYQSVKGLRSTTYTTILLDLKVASQYGCVRQPLKLGEEKMPAYFKETHHRNNIVYVAIKGDASRYRDGMVSVAIKGGVAFSHAREPMKLFDPRSADGRREATMGFVRRPSLFVVMDDLQVLPLTSFTSSSISFLQKLNTPLDDLEEHEVKIGMMEAMNLLGASLTSKTALTNGLFYLLKKPKKEAKA